MIAPAFPMKSFYNFGDFDMQAECTSCEKMIDVGSKPNLGKLVICPNCDAHLEVVWLDPVELDWSTEEDDYEDDDDDDH